MNILLQCGHAANAKDKNGNPCCVICAGSGPEAYTPVELPNLAGRKSKCLDCAKVTDSSFDLAFFEYRGPGSWLALNQCKNCGYYRSAHEKENSNCKCKNFVPHGTFDFDSHFDGCTGWD